MDLGLGYINWRALGHLMLGMGIGLWLGIGLTLWHLYDKRGSRVRRLLGLKKVLEIKDTENKEIGHEKGI